MAPTRRVMDGGLERDGDCLRCERSGIVLLDGHLCEQCHGEVWSEYEDAIERFGLYHPNAEDAIDGGLVGAGVTYDGTTVLAWLSGPASAEVYTSVEDFLEVYRQRENLVVIWF